MSGGVAPIVRERAARLGIEVEAGALDRFEEHFRLLRRWNRAVGLTADLSAPEAAGFYAEAIQLLDQFDPRGNGPLLDLGSGGGFPGMALAILRPGWEVILVERASRKAALLAEAARRLGLPRVRVLERNVRRPDDLPPGIAPRRLTAKAVGEFRRVLDLLELCCAPGARGIVLTGARGAAEVERQVALREGRLRLVERRPLAGRERSYAVIAERIPASGA